MATVAIVRLVLIGVGVLFMLVAAGGAILEMARGTGKTKTFGSETNPLEGITKLFDALKALWETFKNAPIWLAVAGVGVVLIILAVLLPINF